MAKTPFDADRGQGTITPDPDDVIIIEDRQHPRFDKRIDKPISEYFLASLAKKQLEPGIVFMNEDGKCEIVNGRRRLRGLRELNKRAKPGAPRYKFSALYLKVPPGEDMNAYVNAVRHESNLHEGDSLSEKIASAHEHMDRYGWSAERTGILFGVGPKTIEKWCETIECATPVLEALDANRISIDAAAKLAKLPKRDQAAKLAEMQEGRAPREKASGAKGKAKPGSTKHGRPSISTIRQVADLAKNTAMVPSEVALLLWVLGEMTDEELVNWWPQLASAFDRKAKDAA